MKNEGPVSTTATLLVVVVALFNRLCASGFVAAHQPVAVMRSDQGKSASGKVRCTFGEPLLWRKRPRYDAPCLFDSALCATSFPSKTRWVSHLGFGIPDTVQVQRRRQPTSQMTPPQPCTGMAGLAQGTVYIALHLALAGAASSSSGKGGPSRFSRNKHQVCKVSLIAFPS